MLYHFKCNILTEETKIESQTMYSNKNPLKKKKIYISTQMIDFCLKHNTEVYVYLPYFPILDWLAIIFGLDSNYSPTFELKLTQNTIIHSNVFLATFPPKVIYQSCN